MFCAAERVSVGAAAAGGVAAWKSFAHAPGISVMQAESKIPSVFNLASVVVAELFNGSWITGPNPPVWISTRFGTLPAAICSPSALPLSESPFRNCAPVHAEATVVSSFAGASYFRQ